MANARIKFTYQDYLLLSDDRRYELLEGELCMVPSPTFRHQDVAKELFKILDRYVVRKALGVVMFAPLDVVLSQEDVLQPDLFFIAKARMGIIKEKNVQGPPDIVVEILSEGTENRDRVIKRKLYAKYGVKEYWLVDPAANTIEVMLLGEEGYQSLQVFPSGDRMRSPSIPGLRLEVAKVFTSFFVS